MINLGWTKDAEEELKVAVNWASRLAAGDLPTGAPVITVSPEGLTAAYDFTDGTRTWLILSGGTVGKAHTVKFKTQTAAGDTLVTKKRVIVQ